MRQALRYIALVLAVLPLTIVFQNCGQPGSISPVPVVESISNVDPVPEVPPVVVIPEVPVDVYGIKLLTSNKFICEPFGNMNGGDAKGGLKAELAYVNPSLGLSSGTKNSYLSTQYFSGDSQFIRTPTPIYLSQINVPTRLFDQGFRLSDGSYLSDTKGEKLIEWFGLKMTSVLKLADTDETGYYQLATISDDGSRLQLNGTELINNDTTHSTRMKCATKTVLMAKDSKIPLTYYYNQGPRTEIANVLVWRKVSSATLSSTPYALCDVTSQNDFWAKADSSEAKHVTQLKADGWKILDAKNFELPNDQVNPCATQNNNLISKAQFAALLETGTTLSVDFAMAANIKAKLFKEVGTQVQLIKDYDFSAQAKDKILLDIPALENGAIYSIEFLLVMPASGTQVLNEVRFQVVKQ